MRHTCEHCHTVYEIADAKVAGRCVKVRCHTCHCPMVVSGPKAPERFWCAMQGKPKGPFSREEIELFIDLGDITARTRMWQAGMPNWERVCESQRLSWVYARVVDRLAADDLIMTREPTTADPFADAALLSDGLGWFPDPTLKSGIFILDEATQSQLERLSQTGTWKKPDAQRSRGAIPALFAAAAGAAMAVGGFAWLVVENLV